MRHQTLLALVALASGCAQPEVSSSLNSEPSSTRYFENAVRGVIGCMEAHAGVLPVTEIDETGECGSYNVWTTASQNSTIAYDIWSFEPMDGSQIFGKYEGSATFFLAPDYKSCSLYLDVDMTDEDVLVKVGSHSCQDSGHTPLNAMTDSAMQALTAAVGAEFGKEKIASHEMILKLKLNPTQLPASGAEWEQRLEAILINHYIDDAKIFARPAESAEDLSRIASLLNYKKSDAPEIVSALARIESALGSALKASQGLALFSVESQGYGSFGEGSGFAVVDVANAELIIVETGYAE